MPYAYYANLKARDKAIYRQSDKIEALSLTDATSLRYLVDEIEAALADEDRAALEKLVRQFANALLERLDISPVIINVLAVRPSDDWSELHGQYELAEERRRARVTVWMRTARHKKVVAFRTFLRTVLHELCHHLDYELLKLGDSFHTEGFFKRESSLFNQLVPPSDP